MQPGGARAIVAAVAGWAFERDDIRAVALVGSWARDNPRLASDIDLLLLSDQASEYGQSLTWLTEIKFGNAGYRLQSSDSARYGVVWSWHIHLLPIAELELTFASCSWASIDPVDRDTRGVVTDAFRIVLDKEGILRRLVDTVGV